MKEKKFDDLEGAKLNDQQQANASASGGSGLSDELCPKVTIELNEETRFILGRPNFWCGSVVRRLRELGHNIPSKAEEEQAHVIYWMLGLHEQHGDNWRTEFEAYLKRV